MNAAAVDHYGYSRDDFLAMSITDLRPSDDVAELSDELAQVDAHVGHNGVWQHRLKDGRIIEVDVTSHQIEFEGQDAVLVAVQDVTERNRLEHQLRYRAFHDSLTQLANRALFADRVDHALGAPGPGWTVGRGRRAGPRRVQDDQRQPRPHRR